MRHGALRAAALALALAAAGAAWAGELARPRQVMIQTRFVEIDRKDVRTLGLDWTRGEPAAKPLDPATLPVLGALLRSDAGTGGVLATPQATTRTGEPVEIEVGSPEPVGVKLGVLPVLTDDGRVILGLNVQVAQPGLTKLLETRVAVPDGQSVVIGGLFTEETRQAARGVPGLGDVPVLGALFRKTGFQTGRSDLLILITPSLMGEEGGRRSGPPSQVFQPRPDPELKAPSVPQAPHQPKPGYGMP